MHVGKSQLLVDTFKTTVTSWSRREGIRINIRIKIGIKIDIIDSGGNSGAYSGMNMLHG